MAGRAFNVKFALQQTNPLAHARQPQAGTLPLEYRRKTGAVVANRQLQAAVQRPQRDFHRAALA